ncbi:hypothetical protein GWI33_010280, partial [Rhynchophorus ferrugineus]
AARKDGDTYIEIIIGVLTAIMLLLFVVFLVILIINKRHKLQGSPTLFRNPFGVKMNMKDLLMNFSNGNAQPSVAHSVPITPVSHPDSYIESATPMTYEEYRSSLAGNYYPGNYATLRCTTSVEPPLDHPDDETPPEVPPLPSSPDLHSPLNYRSLQNTPTVSTTKTVSLVNHYPKPNNERSTTKFYTAPREKHRVRAAPKRKTAEKIPTLFATPQLPVSGGETRREMGINARAGGRGGRETTEGGQNLLLPLYFS